MATTSTEKSPPPDARDWSEIPQCALHLISIKLCDIINFIRFRAVCPRWRSSAPVSDFRPQLFWIVDKPAPNSSRSFSISTECYPTESSRLIVIENPKLPRMVKDVSWYHHMLVLDETNNSLSLLNPLTKREISLPPMNVAASSVKYCEILCMGTDHIRNVEYVVVFNFVIRERTLSFCEIGDDTWKTLKMKSGCHVCAYYHGMFFVHDKYTKRTKAINVTTGSLQFLIPYPDDASLGFGFGTFVESSGKLLAISYECVDTYLERFRFEIHELNYVNGDPRWVKINNIRDQFLLLRLGANPYNGGGLSLSASDFPAYKPNSIYLFYMPCYNRGSFVVKYDISDGSCEKLPFLNNVMACFLPTLK